MSRRRRSRNTRESKAPCVVGICASALSLVLIAGALFPGCSQEGVREAISIAGNQALSYEAYEIESLPAWFAEDFFDGSWSGKTYANESETVFGLTSTSDPETVFRDICASMSARNWARVESSIEHCASFVRERGSPAWALISCSQIGDETSVVICTEGRLP